MKFRVQNVSQKLRIYALLLIASLAGVLFVSSPSQAATGINGQMNFQGRLLNSQGATVPDGYYNIQFKIYQDGDGQTAGNATGSPAGTLKWTENHLNVNSQGVVVKNGYLSVQLGSITAFGSSVDWNQDTLWLSINIGGTNASCTPFSSCSPDGEMLPMKRLSSTPYAMNAGRVGGLTASQLIQSTTTPQTANIAIQSAATNSIGAQIVGAASQTADIFQIKANGVATSLFAVSAAGATSLQNSADSASAFTVNNQNGRLVLGVDTSTGTVRLGNVTSTSGAGVAGKLILADGTNDNFGLTLDTATLTANRTITLPNESGTLCIQSSTNCGFMTGSPADYIQNQSSAQQTTSNFWISGTGRADTAFQAPSFDTAAAGTLTIGTTNATSISLAQSTTVAAGKSLTITGGNTASRPASPTDGMIYYDTTTKQLVVYNIATGKWQADRAEAVLVAASNSSDADKAAADYVADGTDDQVQINDALAAANPSTGSRKSGKVYLFAGTYTTHQTNNGNATILIPNNVTLAGAGTGTVIRLGDIDATDNLIENSDTATGTGVTIRDLKIDGQDTLNTAGSQSGIYFDTIGNGTTQGARIVNVEVKDFRDIGIVLDNSDNNVVERTTSQGSAYGISISWGSTNNTITGNKFQSNTSTGMYLNDGTYNTITSNNILDNGSGGVNFESSSQYNTFTANTLRGNGGNTIRVASAHNTISGNTIYANGDAIDFNAGTYNTVNGNNVDGAGGSGVGFRLESSANNNTINGNNFRNMGGSTTNNAIYVDASDGNTITNNGLTDGSCTSNCYAINIVNSSSDNTYLSGNTFNSPATINDAGTGTVYAGQTKTAGGLDLLFKQASSTSAVTFQNSTGTSLLNLDTTNGEIEIGSYNGGTNPLAGKLVIANSTNSNTVTITSGATSSSYTTVLPTAIGAAGQCLGVSSVVGSTQNIGYVGCLTSSNSIELQATTPGVAQTGNFNITGTGIVGTMQTGLVAAADDASITVRGGNATVTNANGGNITVTGGAGNGTGVTGLVNLGPTAFSSVVNTSCAANCTIAQANVDSYGTIVVSATTNDINITLPPPTITATKGRTVYITTTNTSQDFTLVTNSGADLIEVAMRKNTTSTMIWSGTSWTPGGASNATTLQATYNNGSNPSTTPEIKLDSIRGTIDIQDADTTIGSDILNIRGSNASGLGTVLFGVSNTGRVTIQGTTDDSSAFRVLNSVGNYLFNINSSNNYVISNSIRSAGNEVPNPGFESGGLITGGEEGWIGPATASIVTGNARSGNNALAITASSANIDVFTGSYYEINAGESLFAAGWVKNSVGANGNAGIQITWYDKDKAVIGNSTAYSSTPGTSYIQRNVGATAPAGTVYARVSATIRSSATTGTFYFDDLYMKRNLESADMTFRNISNSTTGFRIQSANAGNTLFTADTAGNAVRIGDATGTGTDTTVLVVDSATADPSTLTGLNGGIFYRSDSGSLKAIVGGAVVDICTTAVTCTGYSASAGSTIQLQGTSPGTAQTGNFNITGTGILTKLQTQHNVSGSTQALTIITGDAGAGNSGNLTIDTGSATSTRGGITIGTTNVNVTMGGKLTIQGNGGGDTLTLGSATDPASIVLVGSGGTSVSLKAPSSSGTSYSLTFPNAIGATGSCLKTTDTGSMFFQGCGVGIAFNLQDAYNNSGTPADITLTDGKNFQITAADTSTTDPSIVFKLNCTSGCTGTNGRFIVKNSTTDVLSVLPNGNIVLNGHVDIGSGDTSDSTATLFQMDNYAGSTDNGTISCTVTTNAGALYYNSTMGSIRGCINGSWNDISNPDTLGLLTFGIVPSSGSHPYDLPSLITAGYTGPCRASWKSQFEIHIEPCTAYSNGRRVTVSSPSEIVLRTDSSTYPNINLTTSATWGHICLDETTGQPEFTTQAGQTSATAGLPSFSAAQPILCIADVKGSTSSAGVIDDLYDVRTFTSAMKEAVNTTTAVQLGMLADSSTTGGLVPAANGSAKLYGAVVATNGSISGGDPNAIVTTVGPAWVKGVSGGVGSNLGQAGTFVITSTTAGYAWTNSGIPNNSFYYSAGNTRTSFNTTCTAASNCTGSFYVNLIVR